MAEFRVSTRTRTARIDGVVKAAPKGQPPSLFRVDDFFLEAHGRSMTLQEFEKFRISLEQQKFNADSLDPLHYGIQRDVFRKDKLKRLISAGAKVDSKTVKAKIARWKRQLLRLDKSQARLEKLREEITAGKLHVQVPPPKPMRLVSSTSVNARV